MCEGDGIESYESGLLSEALVASLYDRARVVLLPSHYEGFGLPILHGLAHGRPVIARDLPSAREIRESCAAGANLHLAATTRDIVRLALQPLVWRGATHNEPPPAWSWAEAAGAMADGIARGIETFDYQVCFARRVIANTARLRLALAASDEPELADLPDPGQGYMLGRSLDEQLESPRAAPMRSRLLVEVGFVVHPEQVLTRALPHSARTLSCLRLRTEDAGFDLAEVQRRLLAWLPRLRLGGHLQLRMHRAIAVDESDAERTTDPMMEVRLLLLASGLTIDRLARNGEWLIARGTKRTDWQALLPGPQDDLHFIHYLYRQLLGRHPDAGGADNYAGELAAGCDRVDLVKTFLCSPERKSIIARHLVRRERNAVV